MKNRRQKPARQRKTINGDGEWVAGLVGIARLLLWPSLVNAAHDFFRQRNRIINRHLPPWRRLAFNGGPSATAEYCCEHSQRPFPSLIHNGEQHIMFRLLFAQS
jgi:hypothetical protein